MITMTEKTPISIQERCANKAFDAFGEIEFQIDEFTIKPVGSDWRLS